MMGEDIENIRSKLLIPFAGKTLNGVDTEILGAFAYLWSSSPYFETYNPTNTKSRLFHMNVNASGGPTMITLERRVATSVRCFYDFYQPYTPSSSIIHT